jgi:hypothetical protein
MTLSQTRLVAIGALFLFIFASGIWLTRAGRPYSGLLVTLHKLISLAGLVLVAITVAPVIRDRALRPAGIADAVVAGVLFVGTIVSGGVVSARASSPPALLALHRVGPFLTLVSTIILLAVVAGGG